MKHKKKIDNKRFYFNVNIANTVHKIFEYRRERTKQRKLRFLQKSAHS